jgi:hypothetical protein
MQQSGFSLHDTVKVASSLPLLMIKQNSACRFVVMQWHTAWFVCYNSYSACHFCGGHHCRLQASTNKDSRLIMHGDEATGV